MGSGTNSTYDVVSSHRFLPKRWQRVDNSSTSKEEEEEFENVCPAVNAQPHRHDCVPDPVASKQEMRLVAEESAESACNCLMRRRTKCGPEWLIAISLIVFFLHCDVVFGQYSVVNVPPEDTGQVGSDDGGALEEQHFKGYKEAMGLSDMRRIQDLVLRGLNITRVPLASEINISQKEYEEKYRLYLERLNLAAAGTGTRGRINSPGMMSYLHDNSNDETDEETDLRIITYRPNASSPLHHPHRARRSVLHKDLLFVRFPLPSDDKLYSSVEEATLRLMLVRQSQQNHRHHHHSSRSSTVQVHVYQLSGTADRILLDTATVDVFSIGERGKWIEFNVRPAVHAWVDEEKSNLGFEIHCEGCEKQGVLIESENSNVATDFYGQDDEEADTLREREHQFQAHGEDNSPALNIISRTRSNRGKRSRVLRPYSNRLHTRKPHHTRCEEHNGQKCCRSEMNVVFRDLKALDFIIQPKSFDAGYCRGKCPFNYNVASNHAYLQGMIWRQDRKKVPRPCCAPKKLEDLQVLHIDEQDPTKLKVSTWTEMRVLECACS